MKILLWTSLALPSIGGLEVVVHTLALQYKKRGHKVVVIADNLVSSDINSIVLDGITIISFPFTNALRNKSIALMKQIFTSLNALVDQFKPDIVNIHGWYEFYAFYQIRVFAKRNSALILTIHGLIEATYTTRACLQLLALADAVTVVSKALLADFNALDVQCSAPVFYIYNASMTSKTALTPVVSDAQQLVMIGRFSAEKGFAMGVQAVAKLIEKYPAIHLTLVGDGVEAKALKQLTKDLRLEDFVTITGFVSPEQVYTYIDAATLVLMPSTYESFGLVALETALRGRTIIASNIMGLKEVIDHGETGILIEPRDPDMLAATIDYLFSQPAIIERMSRAAIQRAQLKFSIEETIAAYLKLYEQCRVTRAIHL